MSDLNMLVVGPTGSGKTWTLDRYAAYVAARGDTELYLFSQHGEIGAHIPEKDILFHGMTGEPTDLAPLLRIVDARQRAMIEGRERDFKGRPIVAVFDDVARHGGWWEQIYALAKYGPKINLRLAASCCLVSRSLRHTIGPAADHFGDVVTLTRRHH